jgi:hypothetical protein
MDQRERQVIDELFDKLRQVERQAPQRDAEAKADIRQQVSSGASCRRIWSPIRLGPGRTVAGDASVGRPAGGTW